METEAQEGEKITECFSLQQIKVVLVARLMFFPLILHVSMQFCFWPNESGKTENETEIFVGKRVQWSDIIYLFFAKEKVYLGCGSTNTATSY